MYAQLRRKMARTGTGFRETNIDRYEISCAPIGGLQVRFERADGTHREYTQLATIDRFPESPEKSMKRVMEMNNRNRQRMDEIVKQAQVASRPPQSGPPMPGPRSYSPGMARWLTQVRLQELLAGEHPYSYSFNNPTTYTDASGLNPTYINCPPEIQHWLNKICRNLSTLDTRGADAVDRCIKRQAGRHGHKCPGFSGIQKCMMDFCKKGQVTCYRGDIPGYPGASGVNYNKWHCAQSLSNMGSPYFDIFQDWKVKIDGGQTVRLDWLALSFIHEMAHACNMNHEYGMQWGYGAPVDRQCNDYLAFCLYTIFWQPLPGKKPL